MSEVKMKQAFPESVGFSSAPQQLYPNQVAYRPPHPLPDAERRSRTRLTVWSWISLAYGVLNIAAAPIAMWGAIVIVFGGFFLTVGTDGAGGFIAVFAAIVFAVWLATLPAAGVVGMVCALRAARLHRRIGPLGHSAKMPVIVGWIACGLSALIVLSIVIRIVMLFDHPW